MSKPLVRDRKGILEKYAEDIISNNKRFRVLTKIKILWLWRLGESQKFDDEGRPIAAQTRVLPKRERDIYGFDVEIEVFKQGWKRRTEKKKKQLIWHELRHIDVEQNEDFKVAHDDDGRVIVHVKEHDLVVTTFEDEIKKFGLPSHIVPEATILAKALKKKRKEK